MSTAARIQHDTLLRPLNTSRVKTRQGGGNKTLSYLEAFDVRAHLIRVFGFGNFSAEVVEYHLVYQRDVEIGSDKRPGWEIAYSCRFNVTVRFADGRVASYTECAVGTEVGGVGLGDLHDNALKTAESDALKRCCLNLGDQFGLALYDKGAIRAVVRGSLVVPESDGDLLTFDDVGAGDWPEGTIFLAYPPLPDEAVDGPVSDQDVERVRQTLGAKIISDEPTQRDDDPVPGEDPPSVRRVEDVPTGDRT